MKSYKVSGTHLLEPSKFHICKKNSSVFLAWEVGVFLVFYNHVINYATMLEFSFDIFA